jgi:hypothetical protein
VYYSAYFQGDPTAQPDQWTGPESPDGDGPLNADWTDMPHGNYFICRCKTSAGWSPWSNIIPGSLNVTVSQQSETVNFVYAGTNPSTWSLYVFYVEEEYLAANVSTLADSHDDQADIGPTGRSFNTSDFGDVFYFFIVAVDFINGVDVVAAQGEYTYD